MIAERINVMKRIISLLLLTVAVSAASGQSLIGQDANLIAQLVENGDYCDHHIFYDKDGNIATIETFQRGTSYVVSGTQYAVVDLIVKYSVFNGKVEGLTATISGPLTLEQVFSVEGNGWITAQSLGIRKKNGDKITNIFYNKELTECKLITQDNNGHFTIYWDKVDNLTPGVKELTIPKLEAAKRKMKKVK
jgi:hypothetical protein